MKFLTAIKNSTIAVTKMVGHDLKVGTFASVNGVKMATVATGKGVVKATKATGRGIRNEYRSHKPVQGTVVTYVEGLDEMLLNGIKAIFEIMTAPVKVKKGRSKTA